MTKFARQTSVLNKQRVIHSLVTLASRTIKRCNSYCCRCSRDISVLSLGIPLRRQKKLVKRRGRFLIFFFLFFSFLYLPNKGVSKKFEFGERIANIVPLMSTILTIMPNDLYGLETLFSVFQILMLFTNFPCFFYF